MIWNHHVNLVKVIISVKYLFNATVQIYFQGFSQWFIGFNACDTRCRIFWGISNWSKCRLLYWSCHMTLVKVIKFLKKVFIAIFQMCFQSYSKFILCFRPCNTRFLHFVRILNWSNCRSLIWSSHLTLVKVIIFVE